MARVDEKPFPPGDYPVVVVGSGPGGLQTSYCLRRLGIEHAVLSSDDGPGGMFRRFPIFQRLITWTKPWAPLPTSSRAYEWYDWNSLIGDDPHERVLVREMLDGTSYFPARDEMESGLRAFVERTKMSIRYDCRWEATSRDDDNGFVLQTSDGDYRCRAVVFAVGMTEAWKPDVPGIDNVPHYVEVKDARHYENKRVLIIGKRNSGFELADGLLPWAKQLILVSPRPSRISVIVHSTAAARARYLQPFEDHVLGGGNVCIDAAIDGIEKTDKGFTVLASGTSTPRPYTLEVDEVIAATGFTTPLKDLPDLGVQTFYQQRLPRQTPYWESTSVPGIYFAGSITQGSIGLKKYGRPSSSAAVHGFRYNAAVLARHIARKHFGTEVGAHEIKPDDLVDHLLELATFSPELWNQQAYLARVLTISDRGFSDVGSEPLASFVDGSGSEGIAMTVETDESGEIHPTVYVRRGGSTGERVLAPHPLHDFLNDEHRKELRSVLNDWGIG